MAYIQLTKNNIKVGAWLRRQGSHKLAVVTYVDFVHFRVKWSIPNPGGLVNWKFDSAHDMNWDVYVMGDLERAITGYPTERPCKTCGKMNDADIKICWCCGNHP